jgi:hypothetical protein
MVIKAMAKEFPSDATIVSGLDMAAGRVYFCFRHA